MKRILLSTLWMCATLPLFAEMDITVIGKKHENRSEDFEDRPYGNDDMSYGAYFDYFEGMGGWRFGATYATDLSGPGEADTVITPEISLLGRDGIWEGGLSVMMDYIDSEEGSDWGDVYYQTQLGINLPVTSNLLIGIHAFFPFKDLGDFSDIDTGNVDYGVTVTARF